MGTAIVVCLAIGALLFAAGVPLRHMATIAGVLVFFAVVFAIAAPYRRQRLLSFMHPWHDQAGAGFQTVQSMIAIGSGGFFGVGLGESVQKIFYLPEAHTDMILAIIGEELGLIGITAVAALYGMIAYAGLRAAKMAKDRYAQAAGGRHHLDHPLPGHAQLLRGDGARAAHRRAAAVHLVRQLQPDRAARRHGTAAQRGGERPRAGGGAGPPAGDRRRKGAACQES